MAIFTFLGVLCYIFAVIDFLGMFGGYDLTGTPISPVIAGVIGSVLIKIGNSGDDDDDDLSDEDAEKLVKVIGESIREKVETRFKNEFNVEEKVKALAEKYEHKLESLQNEIQETEKSDLAEEVREKKLEDLREQIAQTLIEMGEQKQKLLDDSKLKFEEIFDEEFQKEISDDDDDDDDDDLEDRDLDFDDDDLDDTNVSESNDDPSVYSPIPGTIIRMEVAVGDTVEAGQVVAIAEALKMEFEIKASRKGTVKEVLVAANDVVLTGQKIIHIE